MNLDKAFIVISDQERINVYNAGSFEIGTNWMTMPIIKCESYYEPKIYYRENKYIPITDKEIAQLFLSDNETLIEGDRDEQDSNPFKQWVQTGG